ncbi:MAG TPA: beta-ketoacyl-ACP synthase II, partial [Dermatophilaceae bacterium]|nr:beta-ketoacyl-ACP synthase II [Dermatophilaceae bacterium]
MTANRTRIVVTGLGVTSPVGGTAPETWRAILAGTSGARPMDYDWVTKYDLPVTFAATLKVRPEEVLAKVEIRRLDPSAQFALIASREAWADAGAPEIEPERLAVAMGSGIGGVWTLLDQWDVLREKGPRRVFPLAVPMLMPNAPSAAVSLELGARAGAHTPVSACASGAEGMGYGAEMIRSGRADVVVAGGTEAAIHALPVAGFAAMQALSRRNDDPTAASRPYDVNRDGFVLGEGAAVIVMESLEHAQARGAKIYAELASVGMSADAHHITAPEPNGAGASRAMIEAVQRAGLSPKDILHINAHATSTPVGDVAEYNAIRRAFGDA